MLLSRRSRGDLLRCRSGPLSESEAVAHPSITQIFAVLVPLTAGSADGYGYYSKPKASMSNALIPLIRRGETYAMFCHNTSDTEIGIPGKILAGLLLPESHRNRSSGLPSVGRRAHFGASPAAVRLNHSQKPDFRPE
jgi:hypothetical protein